MQNFILLLLFYSINLFSQDSKKILDLVLEETKSLKNISIDFELFYNNKDEEIFEKKSGNIILEQEKFKLELDNQIIVCNGEYQWIYNKESNEVQIIEYDKNNDFFNPKRLLTIYEKDYEVKSDISYKEKSNLFQKIDLLPIKNDNELMKLSLIIDVKNKRISKIEAIDNIGSVITYNFLKYKFNIKNLVFDFDTSLYDDIYIIDLR